MAARKGNTIAVRGTNDSSTLSKCSMSQHGYFKDHFLKHFTAKMVRRAPLIHRGYYIRTKAIDWILQSFLYHFSDATTQVVSLGAGYDSSCFRLLSEGSKSTFVEIDFPQTVHNKASIIKSTPELQRLLQGPVFDEGNTTMPLRSKQYCLVGVDLCNVQLLEQTLSSLISFAPPTLLLSECVMTYMDVKDSQRLIEWTCKKFDNSMFVTYEQIHPNDGFGLVMQEHFKTLGSPLKAVNTFPTLQSQEERYLQAGYGAVDARDMNTVYHSLLSNSEQQRIEKLELFDEFPEWNLKCAHYTLVLASKGDCSRLHKKVTQEVPNGISGVCQRTLKLSPIVMENSNSSLSRYGHASVALTGDTMLLIGGYGPELGKHSRLNSCLLLHYNKAGKWETSKPADITDVATLPAMMHHTATKTSHGQVIIFGGRQSPKCASDTCYQLTPSVDNCGANQAKQCSYDKWKIDIVKAKGQLPLPRYKHSAVNVQAMDGTELIVMFGGRSNTGEPLDSCCVFDVNTNTWEEVVINGEVPTARFSHSSFMWKNNVYIIGGLGHNFTPLNSVYKLTIQTSNKLISEQLKMSDFPSQYASSAVCHGDVAYLVGGVSCQGNGTTGMVTIHLPSLTWSQCGVPAGHRVILANHTAHYRENSIVILGGGGNCFSFGTHYNPVYSLELA